MKHKPAITIRMSSGRGSGRSIEMRSRVLAYAIDRLGFGQRLGARATQNTFLAYGERTLRPEPLPILPQ